jgi:hypothetical protein
MRLFGGDGKGATSDQKISTNGDKEFDQVTDLG